MATFSIRRDTGHFDLAILATWVTRDTACGVCDLDRWKKNSVGGNMFKQKKNKEEFWEKGKQLARVFMLFPLSPRHVT